jgi:tetratricopeptide (TPR) repeat protein
LLAGIAIALGAAPALAQPTLWQRVEHPRARAEAKLLASLERMLDDANRGAMVEIGLDRELARGAVVMIELSGLSEPSDPRLARVEAQALVEADVGREADARRLLEGALEALPAGSRAASAWRTLAFALARLDDQKAEYRAYSKLIELTWDPQIRANAFANRGDVAMLGGDLAGARSDYEQAIRAGGDPEIVALARYGLAVAEERLGDLPAAYAALDKALALRLPVPPFSSEDPLDLPGVYFVPPYEENYIRALRAMAVGRRATEAGERRDAYEIAVAEWDTYLARSAETEPFRENARAHRARSERELEKATTAERSAPPRSSVPQRSPQNP